jgi:hypothetical protein
MCEGPIPIPWDARLDRVATDIVVWLPCAASGWASMGGGGGGRTMMTMVVPRKGVSLGDTDTCGPLSLLGASCLFPSSIVP